jgi:hypothetical protein
MLRYSEDLSGETRFYVWCERRFRPRLDAVWRGFGVKSKVVFITFIPAHAYGRYLPQTETTLAT